MSLLALNNIPFSNVGSISAIGDQIPNKLNVYILPIKIQQRLCKLKKWGYRAYNQGGASPLASLLKS